MKKLISAILAVVLLVGAFALQAGATLDPIYIENDDGVTNEIDYKQTVLQYLSSDHQFSSGEDKLKTMTLKYEKDGYQLWADEFTGEVATVNVATGEILFSNPIDIASSSAAHSNTTRYELMSQISVKYLDNGNTKDFHSFEQAAMNGQIDVKNIKNGLRVEYTIGREETKYLVPRLIEKERMETLILGVIAQTIAENKGITIEEAKKSFDYIKVSAYYTPKDPNTTKSDRELSEMQNQFPITKKQYKDKLMAVYVYSGSTATEFREVETRIKTYCPLYTFEQLDYDHELTEYVQGTRAPALFKMALEYRLDEFGLTVRLPANGIRFNEAEYQLESISILPWMGAGTNTRNGYTFYPDGSGALFRFEDLKDGKTHTIDRPVYGDDYAYHKITNKTQEVIRYPVFGIVEDRTVVLENAVTGEKESTKAASGFVAILEKGDALANIVLKHYGAVSKYNSVYVVVNPRPKDQYILSEAISVGSTNSITVISDRKYVGDYKLRYIMLADSKIAAKNEVTDYFESTWLGMATAYRAYLTSPYSTGTQNLPEEDQVTILNRLTDADVKENIPLYIETFGSVETIKKVLSIPVNTKVALTTFENIQEMYTQLSEAGIDNVNFKLTGYYNGGMYSSVPYKLEFEKSAGGKKGFEELIADAKERGYGVYVDFNFVYANSRESKAFDGLNKDKDLVKAIDDRFTSKQYYSVTRQSYTSYFELAISPSRFAKFYDKVTEEYLSYNPIGISLSTLASDLNSDFDEDDPYNREDSKQFTIDLFEKIDKDYSSVMSESANAYTWAYLDHMINAAVDSSRYLEASNSVPFLGVVLHGYIQFAGTPLNMEGDVGYAMLKAIENGSGLYFILSYDNTELLKEDERLSQYYSVRYDIWFEELKERYEIVNNVLKDLQTKLIINHQFLIGERVPDEDEVIADKEAAEKREEEEKLAAEEAARIELINAIRAGRYDAKNNAEAAYDVIQKALTNFTTTLIPDLQAAYAAVVNAPGLLDNIAAKRADVEAAKQEYEAYKKEVGEFPDDEQKENLQTLKDTLAWKESELKSALNDPLIKDLSNKNGRFDGNLTNMAKSIASLEKAVANVKIAYDEITGGDYSDAIVEDITAKYNRVNELALAALGNGDDVVGLVNEAIEAYRVIYNDVVKVLPEQDYLNDEVEEEEEEEEKEEEYVYTKYTNDNGNIVAITYGGKDGNDADPFQTFILNYNFFKVTVVYEDVTYEIPAFGFIVITH